MGLIAGKTDHKPAPASPSRFGVNRPAVGLDNVSHNGQSESAPFRCNAGIRPIEGLEDARPLLGGDSGTMILHF